MSTSDRGRSVSGTPETISHTGCASLSGELAPRAVDTHNRFWEQHREEFEVIPHVLRLLAKGRPVTVDQIAAVVSWPVTQVEAALRQFPSIDRDDVGRVAGLGLTLQPTPHRFTFDDLTVYGWCASDTLIFPVVLGRCGVIESTCLATGAAITIQVTPDSVEKVTPTGAVVSMVRPISTRDIRAEACDLGWFFSSRHAAADWLTAHPEGLVRDVAEDFELTRQTFETFGWAYSSR